jgi:hypothetical protein
MRRSTALTAVVVTGLIGSVAVDADTITSACKARTGTLYNVVTDGAKAEECREGDERVRLREVVDTTTYHNVRGAIGADEELLAELGASPKVAFWLFWDPSEDVCLITATFPEPETTRNLQTGKTVLQEGLEFEEAHGSPPWVTPNDVVIVLMVDSQVARGEFSERAFLREETGEIFMFSNAYVRIGPSPDDPETSECFGAVTLQRDVDRDMFAK